jgi:general secretion pathway protein D
VAGFAKRSHGRNSAPLRQPLFQRLTNDAPSIADGAPEDRSMKRCWLRTGFVWLAVAACSGQAWPADTAPAERAGAAAPARPTGPDVVTLNFVNADIEGVVKAVSEITGKNFVLDPRVKGTVNIVSAKPMSRALVYEVFLSAMRLQGFTAVEERGRVMIVPEIDAKLHQSPTLGPQDKSRVAGDIIQTQVFKLQYESATQMVPVLRPLIAPNNTITAYQNNNTLVVTDYASNLARIEKIIESIDQPGGSDPIMIPLHYASALDVAQTINRLFTETTQTQAAADPAQRFTVAADARSNSVLARAGDPSRLSRVRQLVAMLDSPTSAGGNIHVVYLKNAEAVKLAEILRAIYSGEAMLAQPRPTTPLGAAPMGAAPLGQMATPAQTGSSTPGIIQADAATNSIIITAPDAIYNNLRAALEKLDVRRAQVYIEALIAEVTADKAAEFGIQWQDLTGAGKTTAQAFGGTNFGTAGQNIIGISQNPSTAGKGLNIGVVKGTITVGGAQILNLGLLVRALATDVNANILSTPTLLTLDNEEAKIVVGQNVPFITGSYAVSAAATTPTPFQTIERKDVGLTLRIKPQISEGGAVRLQIYQEVSSIQDSANAAGVITNKRSVESSVLVDDGQIIVIGGLIQDTVNDSLAKVPGLGDLPLIGGLFKYNNRSRTKTNLMVFLRPTLLRSTQRADSLTSDRYDYILGEQFKARLATDMLPDFGSPILPPRSGAAPAGTDKPATPK